MEMPAEAHKTAAVSCVTPATMFPCAIEADGHAVEKRKHLSLLGESSFLSSSLSCRSWFEREASAKEGRSKAAGPAGW